MHVIYVSKAKGFTLIELLISMTLIATLGTVIVGILISGLRGARKAQTIAAIQQNGSYAIDAMTKEIRFGTQASVSPDNNPAVPYTSCLNASAAVRYRYLSVLNTDGTYQVFFCEDPIAPNDIGAFYSQTSSDKFYLNTTSNGAKVVPGSCSFSCRQPDLYTAPQITIKFSLNQSATTGLNESTGSVPFQTTVQLRNYQY